MTEQKILFDLKYIIQSCGMVSLYAEKRSNQGALVSELFDLKRKLNEVLNKEQYQGYLKNLYSGRVSEK